MACVDMRRPTNIEPPQSDQLRHSFGSPLNDRGLSQPPELPSVGLFSTVLNTTASAVPTETMVPWYAVLV